LPALTAVVLIALSFDRAALRDNRWRQVFDFRPLWQMRLLRGAVIVAVLAGSWYVLALFVGGWPFFRKQILAENVFTFLHSDQFGGGHRHGPFYLPGQLLLGFLPWTLFLPGLVAALWRERRALSLTDPRSLLMIWSGVVLGFYQIAASKRGVYLLAAYPALALLLGWWWNEQWREAERDRWLARVVGGVSVVVAAILLLATAIAAAGALGLDVTALAGRWLPPKAAGDLHVARALLSGSQAAPLAAALMLAAGAWWLARSGAARVQWRRVFVGTWLASSILLVAARLIALPVVAAQITVRDFMTAVRSEIGSGDALAFYGTFDYGAVYYSERHIPQALGAWPPAEYRFLLVEKKFWEQHRNDSPAVYEEVRAADPTGTRRHSLVLLRRKMATSDSLPR
jgi:hypothetical protein